jgi:hypothetical protein
LGKYLRPDSLPRFEALPGYKRHFGDLAVRVTLSECRVAYQECRRATGADGRGGDGDGDGDAFDPATEPKDVFGTCDADLFESYYGSRWHEEGRVYAVETRHSMFTESFAQKSKIMLTDVEGKDTQVLFFLLDWPPYLYALFMSSGLAGQYKVFSRMYVHCLQSLRFGVAPKAAVSLGPDAQVDQGVVPAAMGCCAQSEVEMADGTEGEVHVDDRDNASGSDWDSELDSDFVVTDADSISSSGGSGVQWWLESDEEDDAEAGSAAAAGSKAAGALAQPEPYTPSDASSDSSSESGQLKRASGAKVKRGRRLKSGKRRVGQDAGAGRGAPGKERATKYSGCTCKGSANVLYNPFSDSLVMLVTRTAHVGEHADCTDIIPDVPVDPGLQVEQMVRVVRAGCVYDEKRDGALAVANLSLTSQYNTT